MRSAGARAYGRRVTAEDSKSCRAGTPVRVWLELDLEAQPIAGTIGTAGARPSPFFGWLGLTAALEGLEGPHRESQGDETQ